MINIKKIMALCLITAFSVSSMAGCSSLKNDSSTADSTEVSVTDSQTQPESSEDDSSASEKSSENDIIFNFANSNSWTDGSETIYQLDGSITNKGSNDLSDWKVTVTVSDGSIVKNSWGMKYDIDKTTMTITPDENTGSVPADGSINFGIQIASSKPIDTDSAVFTSSSVAAKANNDVKTNENKNENTSDPSKNITSSGNAKEVPAPSTDDWLSVKKNKIVDSDGKEVWLTGCNWFGYNTGTNVFDGLWAADLNTSINAIADHGFNLLRIPISTQLVNNWEDGDIPDANFNQATNSYLVGMNSLEIFDYVIGQCRANGIKIMIDFHCAKTDASGHNAPMWTGEGVSEKDYIRGLEWIAQRYKDDDTIIAMDLENEPHGKENESPRAKWDDSKDSDNWKYIAQKAGLAVLKKNPNLLIMVEGIEIYPKDIKSNGDFSSQNKDDYLYNWWGGNLRGVADNPVDLGKYNDKLVYSPHDYGPTVYEQPWFKSDYDYDSLMKDCWYDNWFYIYDKKIAPLLIGEWGGYMTEPNISWMTYCRDLIRKNKLNHTFWCFNANSGDTGGLVKDDFTTWDEDKYEFVKEVLWQDSKGKFVGLDHQIALGENGITLSEYKD
ncbi:MAG: cellulase family glycosylhydrolase [Oscillospiraceae bacterium]|nr:cellulase family glycosylhydrolase [Oscillospiraceae bacterium]